jgi:hypothetical protein
MKADLGLYAGRRFIRKWVRPTQALMAPNGVRSGFAVRARLGTSGKPVAVLSVQRQTVSTEYSHKGLI